MNAEEKSRARAAACAALDEAGIVLTPVERNSIEIADFGLNDFEHEGLAILVYANTDRYCGKELILLPHQICPEHRHPPIRLPDGSTDPGKMETFRCRRGTVDLYIEGEPADAARSQVPPGSALHYTVGKSVRLLAGEQFTIPSNTRHWFQGGDEGAIVTEFSSVSRDETDIFTDPRIQRTPMVMFR